MKWNYVRAVIIRMTIRIYAILMTVLKKSLAYSIVLLDAVDI